MNKNSQSDVATVRERVAVVGATGYAGQELVRLLARHPNATLTMATASQASSTPRSLPGLRRLWDGQVLPLEPAAVIDTADIIFLALPEAASAELGAAFLAAGRRVIDLSGAFRLKDDTARARWYPATTTMPDGVVYGLTEFTGAEIPGARLVSCPGCYPTASLLALQPLAEAGLLRDGGDVIIDAKSGVSGAGKAPSDPGTQGTPDLSIACLAETLSPMMRIDSGVGPMKTKPLFSTRSAKSAFSLRKP
jgi:N-acetyl-gamma-glutamyl-phosphate reductase